MSWTEYPLPKSRLKEIEVIDCEDNPNVFWHGSPSGDLRGGKSGLHLGTKKAATEALEARIGMRADCEGWQGDWEYGKTLLAGAGSLAKCGIKWPTGFNVDVPQEDFYPTEPPTYSDRTEVSFDAKPEVAPYLIVREMTNWPWTPYDDIKANVYMSAQLKRGRAKRGYYYVNISEDAGSISAVVPHGYHLARAKCIKPEWIEK